MPYALIETLINFALIFLVFVAPCLSCTAWVKAAEDGRPSKLKGVLAIISLLVALTIIICMIYLICRGRWCEGCQEYH